MRVFTLFTRYGHNDGAHLSREAAEKLADELRKQIDEELAKARLPPLEEPVSERLQFEYCDCQCHGQAVGFFHCFGGPCCTQPDRKR